MWDGFSLFLPSPDFRQVSELNGTGDSEGNARGKCAEPEQLLSSTQRIILAYPKIEPTAS